MKIKWFGRVSPKCGRAFIKQLFLGLLISTISFAATAVIFQPQSVSVGPFPNNALTVADATTRTGLRIKLDTSGESDCAPNGHASVCSSMSLLNKLDGFSLNPRVMACFSGPIAPSTIVKGMFIAGADAPYPTISLNQIVYDSQSNCAYGKPDHVLDQRSSYFLLVTSDLLDQSGASVTPDPAYTASVVSSKHDLKKLTAAANAFANASSDSKIITASLFTTMSATSWLEDVQRAVNTYPALLLPAGFPYVFNVSDLSSVTWRPDNGIPFDSTNGTVGPQSIPFAMPGIGRIAFGLFVSPNYLNTTDPTALGTITTTSTQPVPIPSLLGGLTMGMVPVSFHVFLPFRDCPGRWLAGGYLRPRTERQSIRGAHLFRLHHGAAGVCHAGDGNYGAWIRSKQHRRGHL